MWPLILVSLHLVKQHFVFLVALHREYHLCWSVYSPFPVKQKKIQSLQKVQNLHKSSESASYKIEQ